jgi:hypothetical protein
MPLAGILSMADMITVASAGKIHSENTEINSTGR